MQFKNSKNELLETTFSEGLMDKISAIVEDRLKKNDIYYSREGTKFKVPENHVSDLFYFQSEALLELMKTGDITMEMVAKDIMKNFG